jgi:quinol monooxygenase YgiN
MAKVVMLSRVRAKPGKRDEVVELCRQNMKVNESEPDFPFVTFHQAAHDPDEFWFYELYASPEADEAHRTPRFYTMMERLGSLVEGEEWSPQFGAEMFFTQLEIFAAKGIDLP